jgi:Protein of unknown function (DUF3465)
MKKLLLIAAVAVAAYFGFSHDGTLFPDEVVASGNGSDQVLADAFDNRRSNFEIEGRGTVTRVLPDDDEGSRHQRFIVRLGSGQSLLVAHNIDLAPRIASLSEGDEIMFHGEYEWNPKGGVIHWTHHDPEGRHPGGWIRHDGRLYR